MNIMHNRPVKFIAQLRHTTQWKTTQQATYPNIN